MHVSVVIPAYNESGRIGATVTHVCRFLDGRSFDWELIVVIDGGPPAAADEARTAAADRSNVRVLVNEVNRGKGFSVRRGLLEARGKYRMFLDADLSLPIEGLDLMLDRFERGADVVIASRLVDGAREIGTQRLMRRPMSRLFNLVVQAAALPGLSDTQCGFKGFSAAATERIFPQVTSDRFGFDVEALFLARKHGLRIDEMPVTCRYHESSSVRHVTDGFSMLREIFAIRRRHQGK